MRKGKIFRIVGAGFMLLLLVAVSTYAAAGNALQTVQEPPVLGDAQAGAPRPEIRTGGYSYGYLESPIAAGRAVEEKDLRSPLAVEGRPRELNWTPVRRVAVRPSYPQTLYATIDNWHGLWRSTNGGGFWEQLPFGAGSGRAIVFANSSTAVAAFGYYDGDLMEYVNGGIWRTDDGGNTWQDLSAGIANMVVAVAFDPSDPNRMYASTYGAGIYRGDYSGGPVTWEQKNTGLVVGETWIYSIAVSPTHPEILYAGGYYEVYRSDNYGDSWIVADNAYPSDYTEGLAIPPGDGDTWYAGARRMDTSGPLLTYGGFYKSTTGAADGGLALKNTGMTDTFVLDIAQDPVDPDILYAGTWGSGFFRSDDGGDTWVERNAYLDIPYIYGIEAVPDPGNPGGTILYLANFYDGAGVFVSSDRGDTWTDPAAYLLPEKFDITTTTDAYHLAAATGQGVFGSDDGGVNWWYSPDLTNLRNGIVLELARDPNNPSKLLAATYGGGIWTSTTAGGLWTETSAGIGDGAYVYDVTFSSTAPNTAYAASYGVYRTTDGGATWAPFGSVPHYVRDVDGHNGSTSSLFAGTHDAGVYTSPSASPSWTAINTDLGEHRIRSLKALASNQVFAGTNGSGAWEYNGSSWTQAGPSIRAPTVIQIAIHPWYASTIYAATDQGVYMSTDSGESWVPKNVGLGGYGDLVISGISIDPGTPSTIYLGTWGYGIFKSTDSGDHWTRLADPLKCSKTYLPLVLKNYSPPVVGFDSQFNGSAEGWVAHVGDWNIGSTVLWTDGIADISSSASYTQDYSDFEYEARVGRLGCDWCANRLYVRGTPNPLTSSLNWYHEYKFQYSRDGEYSIWKRVAGGSSVAIQGWTYSSAIFQGDSFNVLKVIANGPNLYFYINGSLVWSGTDYSLSSGRVGLGMYRDADSTGNQFQADWARLTPLSPDVVIDDVVDAEQQALNDAANQRGGGSEDEAPPTVGGTAVPGQESWPLQEQTEPQGSLSPSD